MTDAHERSRTSLGLVLEDVMCCIALRSVAFARRWRLVAFALLVVSCLTATGCPFGTSSSNTDKKPEAGASSTESKAKKSKSPTPVKFVVSDVTSGSGFESVYKNDKESDMRTILESLGGGLAVMDYDRDGVFDLATTKGGRFGADRKSMSTLGVELFRGRGPFRFEAVGQAAHFHEGAAYNHGLAVGDYDADGFPDVLVTGYGQLQLFHNLGDGSFEDVAVAAGLADTRWSTSPSWGDYNGDSLLDVYIPHYVDWGLENNPVCHPPGDHDGSKHEICSPRRFNGLPDVMYYNNGDGTFRDVSVECGLREPKNKDAVAQGREPEIHLGKGLGSVSADVDLDGDLDVYVGNDTVDNFLWINDGKGVFRERGMVANVAIDDHGSPNGSMGVDVFDYNNDLLPDIFAANFENESFALYRNDGRGAFEVGFSYVSHTTGIAAMGELFVGFGSLGADLDLDGDEDIVVANGHVILFSTAAPLMQKPLLIENTRRGSNFRYVRAALQPDSYFETPHMGRGVVFADLDSDGDLDMAFTNTNEPAALLKNETPAEGKSLAVRLVGRKSNRDAIGATVTLTMPSGKLRRWVKGGASYLSATDRVCHFGVPKGETPTQLEIVWPSGQTQTMAAPELGRETLIIEP